MTTPDPIEVTAFEAANARSYLHAVFAAWEQGHCVMVLPAGGGQRSVPGTKLRAQESFAPDPGWFDAPLPQRPADAAALVAFSSGTTGTPKAILISHGALQDVVARINTAMGVDDTIREYLGVPVTYSFGFGRARAVATAGGRCFLPEHGFDPSEIARMLGAGEINAVSAVPTLWRVLLANKSLFPGDVAKNLKWIEIGSQLMTAAEKLDLRSLFPNARIVQHYGLTEASRSTLLDISNAPEDRLDSVGRAEGDAEIAIDEDGRIRVRGPHLATGLVTEDGLTPVIDADGWLTTSDRGRIDDGWLTYEGRVDELINSGGIKIDPTAFEQAVNSALGVPGAVAAGRISDALRGERVLVALRRDAGLDRERVTKAVSAEAARRGLTASGAVDVRLVEAIPTTDTGKIKRAELADLPDLGATKADPADTGTKSAETGSKTGELQLLWAEILNTDTVPVDQSFYDLGGDSLSALTAILRMEKLGIDPEIARGIFAGKTIAEMAGETPGGSDTAPPPAPHLKLAEAVNAIHATRGVLVLWVVVIHWLPAILQRLDPAFLHYYIAATPAWRFGTPGFAIVFGMGVGALGLHRYMTNRAVFTSGNRFNIKLVLGGVVILAIAKFCVAVAEGQLDNRLTMSALFYSAISFYALALLSLPAIMWLLSRGTNRLLTIVSLGAGAALVHLILHGLLAHYQPAAPLEGVKLALTAKYGYFRMMSFVMVGVAIGWLFRRQHDAPNLLRDLGCYGLVLLAFGTVGVVQAAETGARTNFGNTYLWHLAVYAGVSVLILAGFARLNSAGGPKPGLLRKANAFFVASGLLALPIFVGHEIIFEIKQLFDVFGIPDGIALGILLSIFFVGFFFAYRKIWRLLAH